MARAQQGKAGLWHLLAVALGACSTVPAQAPTPRVALDVSPIPKPPPPPIKFNIADLAKMTPNTIQAVFGAPSLARKEGGMSVLQFTSGSCIADMVFNQAAQLIHMEARAKSGTPIDVQPCLDSFSQQLPATPTKTAKTDS